MGQRPTASATSALRLRLAWLRGWRPASVPRIASASVGSDSSARAKSCHAASYTSALSSIQPRLRQAAGPARLTAAWTAAGAGAVRASWRSISSLRLAGLAENTSRPGEFEFAPVVGLDRSPICVTGQGSPSVPRTSRADRTVHALPHRSSHSRPPAVPSDAPSRRIACRVVRSIPPAGRRLCRCAKESRRGTPTETLPRSIEGRCR